MNVLSFVLSTVHGRLRAGRIRPTAARALLEFSLQNHQTVFVRSTLRCRHVLRLEAAIVQIILRIFQYILPRAPIDNRSDVLTIAPFADTTFQPPPFSEHDLCFIGDTILPRWRYTYPCERYNYPRWRYSSLVESTLTLAGGIITFDGAPFTTDVAV